MYKKYIANFVENKQNKSKHTKFILKKKIKSTNDIISYHF